MKIKEETGNKKYHFRSVWKINTLVFVMFLSNLGFAQETILDRKISIDFKGNTLKEAIRKVQEKSGVRIAFNSGDNVMNDLVMDEKAEDQSIKDILKQLLYDS